MKLSVFSIIIDIFGILAIILLCVFNLSYVFIYIIFFSVAFLLSIIFIILLISLYY